MMAENPPVGNSLLTSASGHSASWNECSVKCDSKKCVSDSNLRKRQSFSVLQTMSETWLHSIFLGLGWGGMGVQKLCYQNCAINLKHRAMKVLEINSRKLCDFRWTEATGAAFCAHQGQLWVALADYAMGIRPACFVYPGTEGQLGWGVLVCKNVLLAMSK